MEHTSKQILEVLASLRTQTKDTEAALQKAYAEERAAQKLVKWRAVLLRIDSSGVKYVNDIFEHVELSAVMDALELSDMKTSTATDYYTFEVYPIFE